MPYMMKFLKYKQFGVGYLVCSELLTILNGLKYPLSKCLFL
jgi:hypothetical protein